MSGSIERNREGRERKSLPSGRDRSRSPPRRVRCMSNRVIISNIPYEMSWTELKDLVKKEVGYTGFVEMLESNGRPSGVAVVEFKTPQVAGLTIEKLHKFKVQDRNLIVREDSARDREPLSRGRSSGPSMSDNDLLDMMDFMSAFVLEKMGMDGPPTDSVHVSNLEFSTTWQKLKDYFRFAGHVINADIKEDADGRSRGFGIVKFSRPYEAVQAVAMFNGMPFYGRPLRVKIDREGDPPRRVPVERIAEIKAQSFDLLPFVLTEVIQGGPRSAKSLAQLLRMTAVPEGAVDVGSGFGAMGLPLRGVQDIALWIEDITRGRGAPAAMMPPPLPQQSAPAPYYNTERDYRMGMSSSSRNADPYTEMQALIAAAMRGGMREEQILSATSAIGLPPVIPSHSRGMVQKSDRDEPSLSMIRGGGMERDFGAPRMSSSGQPKSVVVKNLPFMYDWQDLMKGFSAAGDVRTAEVRMDENKRSKGFGFVHFFSADDAQRAVDMFDGRRFDGREISVQLC